MKLEIKRCFICFAGLVLLSGCVSKPLPPVYGYGDLCSKQQQCDIVAQLQKERAKIYYIGDTLSIVVPQDQIFEGNDTVISAQSHKTLNDIAELLDCYQKISVSMTLYIQSAAQSGMASMRMQALERYFSKKQLNIRLLFSKEKVRRYGITNTLEIVTRRLP